MTSAVHPEARLGGPVAGENEWLWQLRDKRGFQGCKMGIFTL